MPYYADNYIKTSVIKQLSIIAVSCIMKVIAQKVGVNVPSFIFIHNEDGEVISYFSLLAALAELFVKNYPHLMSRY